MKLDSIKRIGIAGAGTMGSGIALIFAKKGYKVTVMDLSITLLEDSRKLVDIFNQTLLAEELMTSDEEERVMSNIEYSLDKSAFKDCDLIIEAIVEKLEVKQSFWKEVKSIAKKDAYLATNTSGLSINSISEDIVDKTRFVGMHFWNPPHIVPLVELIKGDETSDETVEVLKSLMKRIDKEPVIVQKDTPGFIGNRLQFAAFREALHILKEGVGTVEDIDKAMRFGPGFRYPVLGPLETADLGGLDTFYYISAYLFKNLSDSKEAPEILKEKIDSGNLGVKTKEGFYEYFDGQDEEVIKRRDSMFIKMLKLNNSAEKK
ncbi:3-hydroxyacyl-CoA dehydrogenase family protein [Gudongella sp. DL1XJH-153]|uniref:3-hydroxyacyl-CoA dehydrogenase family protein n=1 Tax=Gudongella sp. DL1XJH-153 TaxID=3409804 RepID=UPI003BB7B9E8